MEPVVEKSIVRLALWLSSKIQCSGKLVLVLMYLRSPPEAENQSGGITQRPLEFGSHGDHGDPQLYGWTEGRVTEKREQNVI